MVKFKFFVHCKGHKTGGYYNTHFARNEDHANRIIEMWNKNYEGYDDHHVDLISVTEITDEEFTADYIGGACYG